jgi:hypothetical protein
MPETERQGICEEVIAFFEYCICEDIADCQKKDYAERIAKFYPESLDAVRLHVKSLFAQRFVFNMIAMYSMLSGRSSKQSRFANLL